MTYEPDWNSALIGNEDDKALTSSEVFRNYVKVIQAKDDFVLPLHVPSATIIDQRYVDAAYEEAASWEQGSRERAAFLAYARKLEKRLQHQKEIDAPAKVATAHLTDEQKKTEEENKKKFDKDSNDIMGKVNDYDDHSKEKAPIMPNFPYDRFDYQEKAKNVLESREDGQRSFPEYGHGKKSEAEFIYDMLNKVAEEVAAEAPVEETEVEEVETEEKAPAKSAPKQTSCTELYKDTDAGNSKYFDVGLSSETAKLMEKGIDYMGTKTEKAAPKSEEPAEKTEEAEVAEAEVALGLDKNIFYILRKMGK